MNKLTIIGAGSIAEALIHGMVKNQLISAEKIWITNHQNEGKLVSLREKYGVSISYKLEELLDETEIIILAMKPKDAKNAIHHIKQNLNKNTLIISVLAGVSIHTIEKLAGAPLSVIRAMPNTSAAVGKSATAITINERVTMNQLELAQKLLNTIGITSLVKEEQLDAVTALSGSGPAYIYYLVEAMEKGAAEIGLEKELAKNLIVQTLLGAAAMLAESEKPARQLRADVTSPGGTTEAGIRILEEHRVQDAFISCLEEARNQSKRLGKAFKFK